MPLADELKDRFETQGVGTYNVDIFIGQKAVIPVGDGPFLSIVETGGAGPALTQNDTATERPSAQLISRGTDAAAARAMLKAAYLACGGANGLHNVVLSGTAYLRLVPKQSITEIGEDDPGRAMFSFNVDAEKQPS